MDDPRPLAAALRGDAPPRAATPAAAAAQAWPLDLPRLVMRRAAWVGAAVLLLALGLGLARMASDIGDEVDAAMALADVMAHLGNLSTLDDAQALRVLHDAQHQQPLRHLVLQIHSADGQPLLPAAPGADQAGSALTAPWLALHRHLLPPAEGRRVSWTVPRPDGRRWTVSLAASYESERQEAMTTLVAVMALLLACVATLLVVMRWNMRRAFAPLGRLITAIAGIELHDARAVQALPTMPIRELEAVAAALRHLATALDEAQAQRRRLSQQVLTLQDDERARLARELHDEYGQRLTALRVDAAVLQRRLADQGALQQVAAGMAANCQHIQQDIRALLTRLQPFGPGTHEDGDGETLAQLEALLRALVEGWRAPMQAQGTVLDLQLLWLDEAGRPQPWPDAEQAGALRLPRALALTLYRISQESLTNVARHARARHARLTLQCQGDGRPGADVQLDWAVQDDGVGLAAPDQAAARGNGLAGVRERVWAQGADLQCQPLEPQAPQPGLRLSAAMRSRWLAPADDDGWPGARPAHLGLHA